MFHTFDTFADMFVLTPPTFEYSLALLPLFIICQIMRSCIFDKCFTLLSLLPGVLLADPPNFCIQSNTFATFHNLPNYENLHFRQMFDTFATFARVPLTNSPQLLHTVWHFCNFSQLFGYSSAFLSFLMPPEPCQALQSLPELLEPFGSLPEHSWATPS